MQLEQLIAELTKLIEELNKILGDIEYIAIKRKKK